MGRVENMLKDFVIINGCKHYIANREQLTRIFFFDTRYLCEKDTSVYHPCGIVFKAKGVIDTNVRFVIQPNRSLLLFNILDWERYNNPFCQKEDLTLMGELKKLYKNISKVFGYQNVAS